MWSFCTDKSLVAKLVAKGGLIVSFDIPFLAFVPAAERENKVSHRPCPGLSGHCRNSQKELQEETSKTKTRVYSEILRRKGRR